MALKRTLLEEAVRQDPDPDAYEGWLLEFCLARGDAIGPMRALALEVLAEWHLAQSSTVFRDWLEQGAPSEDVSRPS
jgi:hypothetical protein